MHSAKGKAAMRLRKTSPELLFAEGKLYHGLSKFMTRGRSKAQKTSFMIATVQNLKRLMKKTTLRKVATGYLNHIKESFPDLIDLRWCVQL
jgi:hypothetical protein